MKVLFLDHPEADYLAGMLFRGLYEELGEGNVVDYPYKLSYHGQVHRYPNPYPSPGANPADDMSGLTQPFEWMPAVPGCVWSRDEIVSRVREFDLVVVASPRRINAEAFRDIVSARGRDWLPPVVLVDGEDYADIRWDLVDEMAPRHYFKRELVHLVTDSRTKVHALPFASTSPELPPKPKDIEVIFRCGGTWPGRYEASAKLRAAFGDKFDGGVGSQVDYGRYVDALSRAKIAVAVRGHGWDSTRQWDIPTYDTLLVTDRSPQIKPHPFEDGVHAVHYDNFDHMVELVRKYLDDDSSRERIALAGQAHRNKFHTTKARAQQFLELATS